MSSLLVALPSRPLFDTLLTLLKVPMAGSAMEDVIYMRRKRDPELSVSAAEKLYLYRSRLR